MHTVAVTGATGFIGRTLLRALDQAGYTVRSLARGTPPADAPASVQWIKGDLADIGALDQLIAGVDAVIHGAGAVKALSRADFMAANAVGTATLVERAAACATPPRFVHLSSFAARAPHLSAYAASKAAGEASVLRAAPRLPAIVLRPPAVYGPGDREALKVLQTAAHGFVLAPPIRTARLSLVHVEDATRAILTALTLPVLPPAPIEFDDGTPGGHGWPDIAAAAAAALGRPVRVLTAPTPILYLIGGFASLAARLTRRSTVISLDKIGEILHPDWVTSTPPLPGYHPAWRLAEGFRNTAEWADSQGLLKLLRRS